MGTWMKTKAGAKYAGVDPRTFRAWFKLGLRYSRLPSGRILVHKDAIDNFLSSFSTEGTQERLDAIVDEAVKGPKTPEGRLMITIRLRLINFGFWLQRRLALFVSRRWRRLIEDMALPPAPFDPVLSAYLDEANQTIEAFEKEPQRR